MECTWCGDPIEPDAERVTLVRTEQEPGSRVDRDGEVVGAFHVKPLPCFSEARDYGWE